MSPRERGAKEHCQVSIPSSRTITGMSFIESRIQSVDICRNCGLFRYWTLPNLPLFLLATPMFAILVASGLWALRIRPNESATTRYKVEDAQTSTQGPVIQVIRTLAICQLMLVMLTSTTAHVQIITRISSAYPVWLWYVAISCRERNTLRVGGVVKFMVVYSVIQGGLFASFLPPA
jgi:GPI mannosyltransferase 2